MNESSVYLIAARDASLFELASLPRIAFMLLKKAPEIVNGFRTN